MWVRQGQGEVEALTVMVSVSDLSVRVTNGYGPQEYDTRDKKDQFWQYLQDEVNISSNEGVGCIIMMDANSWLGDKIIKGDPHSQNQNGKIFNQFLINNKNMSLLNDQNFCQGIITREKKVQNRVEQSIIDFILVCDKVLPFAKSMVIDEKRIYSLANFHQKKKGRHANISDHNLLYAIFELKCIKQPKERQTSFNFNNMDGIVKFRKVTTETDKFTKCFSTAKPFLEQVKLLDKNLRNTKKL